MKSSNKDEEQFAISRYHWQKNLNSKVEDRATDTPVGGFGVKMFFWVEPLNIKMMQPEYVACKGYLFITVG